MKYESDYLDLNPTWHEEDSPQKVTELIKVVPFLLSARKVMDFGCGAGRILKILAQKNMACTYYGYDISTIALDIAQRDNSFANVQFGDSFPEGEKFDFVLFVDILEHLENSECLRMSNASNVLVRVP